MTNAAVIEVDVRDDLRNGREPFSRIMEAVSKLQPGQELRLIAPFEPAPLYAVLARHGLSHAAEVLESGDWQVRFYNSKQPGQGGNSAGSQPDAGNEGLQDLEVDARGLEPPQPLVTILEAVSALPRGAALRARTERRPVHLHTELENRGFAWVSIEQPDGSFVTTVRHK